MSLESQWKKSGMNPPKVMRAASNSGEKYLVIEDDSTIFKLINKSGQIYVVAGFRCKLNKIGNEYLCGDPIHPISCSKIDNPRERFVEGLLQYL